MQLQVLRDKKKMEFGVKLNERPGIVAGNNGGGENKSEPQKEGETYEFLGVTFSDTPQDLLDKNGAEFGVLVDSVKDSSALSGVLAEGQIIAGINGTPVKSLKDLKTFADSNKNAKAFTFLIIQDGMMLYRGIEK